MPADFSAEYGSGLCADVVEFTYLALQTPFTITNIIAVSCTRVFTQTNTVRSLILCSVYCPDYFSR